MFPQKYIPNYGFKWKTSGTKDGETGNGWLKPVMSIIPTILNGETTMDQMPLLALIFQSIPESVIILTLGLTLMGLELKWQRIIPAGVLSSLCSYFVRELPIPYGVHTLIGIIVIALLVIMFFKTSVPVAICVAMIGIVILITVEILIWPVIIMLTGKTMPQIWHSQTLRILLAIPELILLASITLWCIRKKVTLRSPGIYRSNQTKDREQD
ncbi:hypothetical protein [Desulfofundulus salinus]|uniref:Uncharacterized protein n=1 Tax=Desulfofundulus salinus TaxID=2419843 RepID=A0A494X0E9_9FIRM|nr:hypothetical protein [Desulfofundulus salinum]RKO66294.1 hypothetical protein D7024_04625 [Desulfofundulus salinum]